MDNPFLIAIISMGKSIRIQRTNFDLDVCFSYWLCLYYSGFQNCQQPLIEKEMQQQDSCAKDFKNNTSYGNAHF